MYKCFQALPPNIRQQAFETIVQANGYQHGRLKHVAPLRVAYHNRYCCPWGIINACCFGLEKPLPGGHDERDILEQFGYHVNVVDITDFMVAVDRGEITTLAQLAEAMGVGYRGPV